MVAPLPPTPSMPYKHARAGARWSTIEEPKDELKVMGGEEAAALGSVVTAIMLRWKKDVIIAIGEANEAREVSNLASHSS